MFYSFTHFFKISLKSICFDVLWYIICFIISRLNKVIHIPNDINTNIKETKGGVNIENPKNIRYKDDNIGERIFIYVYF